MSKVLFKSLTASGTKWSIDHRIAADGTVKIFALLVADTEVGVQFSMRPQILSLPPGLLRRKLKRKIEEETKRYALSLAVYLKPVKVTP